jgi:hypothetical protein
LLRRVLPKRHQLHRDTGRVTSPSRRQTSGIDEVYDRAIAVERLKHGTKYERLTALVFQLLDEDSTIEHDVRLRGNKKRTWHQIDVRITKADEEKRVLIECRDKDDGNKVGLSEARSFATVIRHLEANGIMVTTTDYTKGAQDLAADESIQLLALRPFRDFDREGRVAAINVQFRAVFPVPEQVHAVPAGYTDRPNLLVHTTAPIISGSTHPTFGALLWSIMDTPLTGPVPVGTQEVSRHFNPPIVTVDSDSQNVSIVALNVSYHVEVNEQTIRIDAGARIAELILRSLDGTFSKVVWREDLHRFILDESGTVRSNSPPLRR